MRETRRSRKADATQEATASVRGEHLNREARPARVPMSGRRLRMEIPESMKEPGYFYYWFNDNNDDIQRAIAAGYEHVSRTGASVGGRDVDSATSDGIMSMSVGKGVTAYLMRQPMEFREEDVAARDRHIDDVERTIHRTLDGENAGTYGKIEIT